MKKFLFTFSLLFYFFVSFCQIPIYYENCETTGYNWRATFSGPNTSYISGFSSSSDNPANVALYVSSNTSILHQGSGNAGSGPERVIISLPTVTLNPNVANCFKMKFASIGFNPSVNSGAGVDNQDYLRLNVSYNGSNTFSPEIQVNGGNNNVWTFNTTNSIYRTAQGSLSNYAQVIGNEYSSLTLELPLGTSQVAFEIDLSLNAAGETWLIEDMQILSSCYSPLPIELLYFQGNYVNNQVELEWATITETNNDFFEIISSDDLKNESLVIKIQGVGNSTNINHYYYVDFNPKKFYKLCQVDYNGQKECFDWISINKLLKEEKIVKIFDVFGRITTYQKNNLIFIVNDKGEIKKLFIMD